MNQDEEHLRLLSIFHYVVAGLAALFACLPVFHFTIGLVLVFAGLAQRGALPAFFGLIFVLVAGFIMLCGWGLAVCLFIAGRYIARRQHYTFCLVVAGVSCAFAPFGTVLGVFTIIVLTRLSVKEMFGAGAEAQPTA